MSRPQSEAKLGYYPFPEACLELLAAHFEPPADPTNVIVLDPCAGEGYALARLGLAIDGPLENLYAIELARSRAETLARSYPSWNLMAPADFTATSISPGSFSLVYCNPPYAAEMGGGRREELTFAVKAINLLVPGGVLCLVCPEEQVLGWGGAGDLRRCLNGRLEDLNAYALPGKHRQYGEIVVLGRKRRTPLVFAKYGDESSHLGDHGHFYNLRDKLPTLDHVVHRYALPPGVRPRVWRKTGFTPEELADRLARSPLLKLLKPPPAKRLARPPLPPGQGHIVLLLASGLLDGLVEGHGRDAQAGRHVVRGTARKVPRKDEERSEVTETASGTTTKTVVTEQPQLLVRALCPDGTLHSFASGDPQ